MSKDILSFFERIGKCVMLDICNRITIENNDLYEEVIVECLESAYDECIGNAIDIECLVKAIYSLNCVRQAVEYLLVGSNFRFRSGHERIPDSLYRLSTILNINVRGLDLTDCQSTCDDLTTKLGQISISEDRYMNKIIILRECLIEIQHTSPNMMQNLIRFERRIQGYFRKFLMDTSRLVDSTRIARHFKLGTWANIDTEEQNFARYVGQFFSYYLIFNHHY